MVEPLVAGLEIDFVRMMFEEIQERAFKTSTTYPLHVDLSEMQGCLSDNMACDTLIYLTRTLDTGLIKDEDNVAAPHTRPRVKVPPLGKNLANAVELDQMADLSVLDHVDPTPISSSHAASRPLSSSRSTPPVATVISIARVQNLEARGIDGHTTPSNTTMDEKFYSGVRGSHRKTGGQGEIRWFTNALTL